MRLPGYTFPVSKSVAELEQEVESLKQRLAELERALGLEGDEPGAKSPTERHDFSSLYGIFKDMPGSDMSWEDWLELKAEMQASFDKAIDKALDPE